MGTLFTKAPDPAAMRDKEFLYTQGHKTYVVTAPGCDFVKVGYTKRTLYKGVWSAYRRQYGVDLLIVRVYPASKYKEDEDIHRKLHPVYGHKKKGREIYKKSRLSELLKELDKWHGTVGAGPFTREDVMRSNKERRQRAETEVLVEGMKFLKL